MTRLIVRGGLRLLIAVTMLLIFTVEAGRFVPPGTQITYVGGTQPDLWDIYLMDIDRRLSINLTRPYMSAPVRNRLPTWSPDGQQMAFTSGIFGRTTIVIYHARTDQMRFLNAEGIDETDAAWSPDGRSIAFTKRNGADRDIYITRLDVDNQHRLVQLQDPRGLVVRSQDDRRPAWSPDGERIAFLSGTAADIALINANGAGLTALTQNMEIEDDTLMWSPQGTHLIFVSQRDGNREIYTVNVTSGAVLNLSRHPGSDYNPRWSPDGTQIAFISNRDGDSEIFVMDRIGGSVQQVTVNTSFDTSPAWSPDGEALLYVNTRFLQTEIHRVKLRMGDVDRLTYNTYNDWGAVWKP